MIKRSIFIFLFLISAADAQIDSSINSSRGNAGTIPVPRNFRAVLHNVNKNPDLPLSISPDIDSKWNADWEIQSLRNRVFIVANPGFDAVNPSPSAARLQIIRTDDFSRLANGHPRAEFQRRNFNFKYGHVYKYSFKLYVSNNFKFDAPGANNANILTQIKQTGALGGGSPPRAFGHNGTQYYVDDYVSVPNNKAVLHRTLLGNAAGDRGKWVKWTCEFKADSLSGAGHGYYKLYKNDSLVYADNDRTWAYTKNPEFYMKVGIYKYDWLNYPSLQDTITVYIDDIQLTDVTGNINSGITGFSSSADTIAHYVDLNWTNPGVPNLDSTYIYSSLTNDPAAAKIKAVLTAGKTSYRDYLTTERIRYYWLVIKDKKGNKSRFSPVAADPATVYAGNR